MGSLFIILLVGFVGSTDIFISDSLVIVLRNVGLLVHSCYYRTSSIIYASKIVISCYWIDGKWIQLLLAE